MTGRFSYNINCKCRYGDRCWLMHSCVCDVVGYGTRSTREDYQQQSPRNGNARPTPMRPTQPTQPMQPMHQTHPWPSCSALRNQYQQLQRLYQQLLENPSPHNRHQYKILHYHYHQNWAS